MRVASLKQGRLNGFLNDFSELSNGSEDKPSGRDAHLGEKDSKSASKADKTKEDNRFINDSQAELDKLLAGVDAKDNTVSSSGDTLGTKSSLNIANGVSGYPSGDTLGTQNKNGFLYRLSGVSSPIQITNTQNFKKNPNYSANSSLMNLKLISTSAASEKPVDAFRYPTANPDNLLRNINLIFRTCPAQYQ
ncbi:hypothetical protein DM298_10845 (plasmid) [Lactobacillus amylovorus]|uniref:Uncharacterized protein n=1 Tax=Lactobacillus amylovorus TaxID=1604 RepID=A0A5E8CR31_LACAM|nr:hypothetical protein [Lactobacillus amylovorus]QDD71357.1 hypothetical protein DM298_10845 [Lactobacillus amylovorus]